MIDLFEGEPLEVEVYDEYEDEPLDVFSEVDEEDRLFEEFEDEPVDYLFEIEAEIDLDRAVRGNRYWGKRLGWQAHSERIGPLLGFTNYRPDEKIFAKAVANWQRNKGLTVDGIIGPSTWGRMRSLISAPGGVTTGSSLTLPAGTPELLRQNAVRIARQEWTKWHPHGRTLIDTDSRVREYLKEYWQAITRNRLSERQLNRYINQREPWSAAFISWVMKKAGAGNAFVYSSKHGDYVSAARENRYAGNDNPFKAYRVDEAAPRIGDLACNRYLESQPLDFNRISGRGYHCDIVTDVQRGGIRVIGGNLSHTVKMNTLHTDQRGYIDRSRHPTHVAIVRIG